MNMRLSDKDLYACITNARQYYSDHNFYLPAKRDSKLDGYFIFINSRRFLRNENIVPCPENLFVPKTFTKTILIRAGFQFITFVKDLQWLNFMAFNLLLPEKRNSFTFSTEESETIELILLNSQHEFEIEHEIDPALIEYSAPLSRNVGLNSRRFLARALHATTPLALHIVNHCFLRCCICCLQPSKSLKVLACCRAPIHTNA